MSIKKYATIVGIVFLGAFCAQYIAVASNALPDWGTLQICVQAGILGVFSWFVLYADSIKKQLEETKDEVKALSKHLGSDK